MQRQTWMILGWAALAVASGCAGATVEPSAETTESMGGDRSDDEDDPVMGSSSGGVIYVISGGTTGAGGSTQATGGMTSNTGGGLQQLPNCQSADDCDDSESCTTDTCEGGFCAYEDNGTCECKAATATADCNDDNECTTDTCVDNECVYAPFVGACEDDGNACTSDSCSGTVCTHADSGLCGEDTVVIRSARDGDPGQWISLDGEAGLVWDETTMLADAELFNQIDQGAGTFKLQALSTGQWVTLNADDDLVATATEGEAMIFEAPSCGVGVGLRATGDDDGDDFVAGEGSGILKARSGGCNEGSNTAWERFEISPAGG